MSKPNEVWVLTIGGKTSLHTSYTVAFFKYFCAMAPKSLRRFVPELEWVEFDHQEPPPAGRYLVEMRDGTVRLMDWVNSGDYGFQFVRRYAAVPKPPEWMP
jgi:hypothetical protein